MTSPQNRDVNGPPPGHRAADVSDVVLSAPALTLSWVIRLRWGAVLGQTLMVALVSALLPVTLPVAGLVVVIAVTALTNLGFSRWASRRPGEVTSNVLAGVLALDTLLLSAALYLTGGPSNPFSVLYLVQVTLAALVLGMGWASAIVVLSAASYAFLFFANLPLAGMEHAHHGGSNAAFTLHLQGMWAAFTLAAGLIAYFVTKVARALRQRDALLERAQQQAERTERLAALSTLAAGAAHELGTPLATIAVAAKELLLATERLSADAEIRDDVLLIREQIARCRGIVQQMSARAGEAMGEAPERVDAEALLPLLRARLSDDRAARLCVRGGHQGEALLVAPVQGLVQALGNLVNNAFDASPPAPAENSVTLSIERAPELVTFRVEDRGAGIAPAVLARVGEPFFTTKEPGAGMGLGLFLARAFAERLGGRLSLKSPAEGGTHAVLELPRAPKDLIHAE